MAIQFIVDSASDILPEEAKSLGVVHLPLSVRFGDEEYADSVNLTHREFYEKLVESDKLPTTSQIPPAIFAEAYEAVTAAGDTAVVVTVSGKLSGTWQSAMIAAEDYQGKVFVVDSRSVAIGQRILVQRGIELREQGLSAQQIAARLETEREDIRILALLDTLEYLKKGGRISTTVALAGSLLSIKPVITLKDGEVAMVGKARGSKQANNLLRQMVTDCGGICFSKPYALAYSGLSDAMLRKYIEDSRELWEGSTREVPVYTVGCTIGAHAGPGAIAVAFFKK